MIVSQLRAVGLALVLFTIAVLVGYNKATRLGYVPGTVKGAEFIDAVLAKNLSGIRVKTAGVVDREYYAPSIAGVRRMMAHAKTSMTYRPEVYDCDDYSRHFKDQLLHQWAKEGNHQPLPIVEIYAVIRLQSGELIAHAFNAIITSEGKMVYIEPQGPRAMHFHRNKILFIMTALV